MLRAIRCAVVLLAACGETPTASGNETDGVTTTADASNEASTNGQDTQDSSEGNEPADTSGTEEPEGTSTDAGDADEPPGRTPARCGAGTATGGTLLWSHVGSWLGSGGVVSPSALAVRRDGVVIVAGDVEAQPPGSAALDAVTLAFDDTGALLWKDRYDGDASLEDRATRIAIDGADGVNVLVEERVLEVVGESDLAISDRATVLRYRPDGTRAWRYGTTPIDHEPWAQDFVWTGLGSTESGDIALVDWYWHEPVRYTALDRWGNADETSLGEVDGYDGFTAFTPDGDVFIGMSQLTLSDDVSIRRLARDGTERWSKHYGDDDTRIVDMLVDGEDGLWVATQGFDGNQRMMHRFGPQGDELIAVELEALLDGRMAAAAVHCSGDLLLVGTRDEEFDTLWDDYIAVSRASPDGVRHWQGLAPLGPEARATGLRVAGAPNGDVFVAGVRFHGSYDDREAWLGRFGGSTRAARPR